MHLYIMCIPKRFSKLVRKGCVNTVHEIVIHEDYLYNYWIINCEINHMGFDFVVALWWRLFLVLNTNEQTLCMIWYLLYKDMLFQVWCGGNAVAQNLDHKLNKHVLDELVFSFRVCTWLFESCVEERPHTCFKM